MGTTRRTTVAGPRRASKRPTAGSGPLSENDQQALYFEWLKTVRLPYDKTLWDYTYAIPNGIPLGGDAGTRARIMSAMKKRGLKPGVADIHIAYPVGKFHGMYIEHKRDENAAEKTTTEVQSAWLTQQASIGYHCAITPGLEALKAETLKYLRGGA